MTELPQPFEAALRDAGLLAQDEAVTAEPITGGVSSDIWKVTTRTRTLCIKSALARLRVEGDWRVPVSRSASEAGWFQVAAGIIPGSVPKILAFDEARGIIMMEYLSPDEWPVWKARLLAGVIDTGSARGAAVAIGKLHAATAGDPAIAARFSDTDTFRQVRLDPYLRTTAKSHPDLADRLETLCESLLENAKCLIHGDFSPKNILVRANQVVILDAECAVYGDPAFDVAFCINHLILKSILMPDCAPDLTAMVEIFFDQYLSLMAWEPAADLEDRVMRLLPALMLARIDGLSPVEYLDDDAQKSFVRDVSIHALITPPQSLSGFLEHLLQAVDFHLKPKVKR